MNTRVMDATPSKCFVSFVLKEKTSLPIGAINFSIRIDIFSEGAPSIEKQKKVAEFQKVENISKYIYSP